MKKQFGDLMKQVSDMQQKMQQKIKQDKEELEKMVVAGESGGGLVNVSINCDFKVLNVEFKKECFNEENLDLLGDLVTAAVNVAIMKAKQASEEKTGSLPDGMQLPPGFKLPF